MENLTGNKSYVKVTVEGQMKERKEETPINENVNEVEAEKKEVIAEEKVEQTEVKPEVELKIEEKVE